VLADRGKIDGQVAARAAETARRLTEVAMRTGARHVLPVATSALRDSPNPDRLRELLETAVGLEVRFIDGREEARLTFAGVRASVALGPGSTLLLDLGGGSLEVALADEGDLRWGRSLPVGAGRLTGLVIQDDPRPGPSARRSARRSNRPWAAGRRGGAAAPVRTVASGGTAGRWLASLLPVTGAFRPLR
jgi:exopolyphosphatase/guanosine-5'-triphosphate,3'-diphosphate pyrophosphatase